jgi:ribonuclease D
MATRVKKKMKMNGALKYRMIDTLPDLEKFADVLSEKKVIGVDLEADSMHHYQEKVCLLQIADGNRCVVIDPLKIGCLSPLAPVFSNPDIQKIFHGSDYDVRSLYRDFQIGICNLFDTELACRFLGNRESGLEAVLCHRFDVKLDKKYQRKDWSVRPLPEEMVAYAAADVFYLIPLSKMLQKELDKKGRTAWVTEECQHLSWVRSSSPNNHPMYLKFKGAGRLERKSLAVLEALLVLRDRIAAERDRPHYKIFGNESLKKLALLQQSDLKHLESSGALSRKQIGMYGDVIQKTIRKALAIPENMLPLYPRRRSQHIEPAARKRMKLLKMWRDEKADTLQLDPSIVFSKAEIAAIAGINPTDEAGLSQIEGIMNWQYKAFGGEILEVLKAYNARGGKGSA